MMLISDADYPMSVDEMNIALETALLEREENYATICESISFSESLLFELWEQRYPQHTECI